MPGVGHRLNATRQLTLLPVTTLAGAVTDVLGTPVVDLAGMESAAFQATFVRAGGGTKVTLHIGTSLDGGLTWIDICCMTFLTTTARKVSSVKHTTAVAASVTPGDGVLADDTVLDGVLGDRLRVRYTSTGTYTGASSIAVFCVTKG